MCVGLAKSEMISCASGHMAMLTMPNLVVELVEKKAEEFAS
jgi:hypothetical protein